MLAEKGISITDLELRMLIESAVGEFNDNFNKDTLSNDVVEENDSPIDEDSVG